MPLESIAKGLKPTRPSTERSLEGTLGVPAPDGRGLRSMRDPVMAGGVARHGRLMAGQIAALGEGSL